MKNVIRNERMPILKGPRKRKCDEREKVGANPWIQEGLSASYVVLGSVWEDSVDPLNKVAH